jgi:hypothetical protein
MSALCWNDCKVPTPQLIIKICISRKDHMQMGTGGLIINLHEAATVKIS